MRTYALEVRGPTAPVNGEAVTAPFEWRVRDVDSDQIVASGAAPTEEQAIAEGRDRAQALLAPGREPGHLLDTIRKVVPRPSRQGGAVAAPPAPAAAQAVVSAPSAPAPALVHRTPRAQAPAPPRQREAAVGPPGTVMQVVRALIPLAERLPTVNDTSDELLGKAMAESGADAGAVLLPDGDVWRVTAGSGLRPLELRVELAPTHWLVRTVCEGRHGITVKDTDIVRQQLAGAPLASRRHLLAVPVAAKQGLLLLARANDPAFDKGALRRVSTLAEAAAETLAEAMDVRRLAERLTGYIDLSD